SHALPRATQEPLLERSVDLSLFRRSEKDLAPLLDILREARRQGRGLTEEEQHRIRELDMVTSDEHRLDDYDDLGSSDFKKSLPAGTVPYMSPEQRQAESEHHRLRGQLRPTASKRAKSNRPSWTFLLVTAFLTCAIAALALKALRFW